MVLRFSCCICYMLCGSPSTRCWHPKFFFLAGGSSKPWRWWLKVLFFWSHLSVKPQKTPYNDWVEPLFSRIYVSTAVFVAVIITISITSIAKWCFTVDGWLECMRLQPLPPIWIRIVKYHSTEKLNSTIPNILTGKITIRLFSFKHKLTY